MVMRSNLKLKLKNLNTKPKLKPSTTPKKPKSLEIRIDDRGRKPKFSR